MRLNQIGIDGAQVRLFERVTEIRVRYVKGEQRRRKQLWLAVLAFDATCHERFFIGSAIQSPSCLLARFLLSTCRIFCKVITRLFVHVNHWSLLELANNSQCRDINTLA